MRIIFVNKRVLKADNDAKLLQMMLNTGYIPQGCNLFELVD